jgi:hypothetical protein
MHFSFFIIPFLSRSLSFSLSLLFFYDDFDDFITMMFMCVICDVTCVSFSTCLTRDSVGKMRGVNVGQEFNNFVATNEPETLFQGDHFIQFLYDECAP